MEIVLPRALVLGALTTAPSSEPTCASHPRIDNGFPYRFETDKKGVLATAGFQASKVPFVFRLDHALGVSFTGSPAASGVGARESAAGNLSI